MGRGQNLILFVEEDLGISLAAEEGGETKQLAPTEPLTVDIEFGDVKEILNELLDKESETKYDHSIPGEKSEDQGKKREETVIIEDAEETGNELVEMLEKKHKPKKTKKSKKKTSSSQIREDKDVSPLPGNLFDFKLFIKQHRYRIHKASFLSLYGNQII